MTHSTPVRVGLIGCGGMARSHLRTILPQPDSTQIVAICEPTAEMIDKAAPLFRQHGLDLPPNEPDFDRFVRRFAGQLDAVFIITPHAYHHDQAKACMEAGIDVLLEKPMVMTAAEAESLIAVRNRTGRLLVVSFQGSLSPEIRKAVEMLRSGELGQLLNINAMVWQNWGERTVGAWRQQPELAGGGFMFDTGAHMLNTVSELAGEDFSEVSAWLDYGARPVDTRGVVMARLRSGALITMNACGETIPSCESDIWVFCSRAILRTGQWGERLELQRVGENKLTPVPVTPSTGPWEQFLAVRSEQIQNPSPPEIGLRMARLWDAIRQSAGQGGTPVRMNG